MGYIKHYTPILGALCYTNQDPVKIKCYIYCYIYHTFLWRILADIRPKNPYLQGL